MTTHSSEDTLLSVEGLRTHIQAQDRTIHAVDGVSFDIGPGETVGLVGESGSGKSVTCESITGLVPQPPAEIVDGRVTFDGASLHDADEKSLRAVRGSQIAHIFQNPQRALDPVYTVGDQIAEAITIHDDVSDGAARERAVGLLRRVGIPRAESRVDDYPHEFSGGMAQRVAIAIALAAEPELLIADEPTTAVDVTVQARLIELFRDLTDDGMALLLITHDFRVVASLVDRVMVMFGGTIVEEGPTTEVFEQPAHPYTQTLFESYDGLSRRRDHYGRKDIPTAGCRFRKECTHAVEACCGGSQPQFYAVNGNDGHTASCVHHGPDGDPGQILENGAVVGPAGGGDDD
jgi:peptide/nickel transport system ATP-binding protein